MFKQRVIDAFAEAKITVGGLNAAVVVKNERFYRRVALLGTLGLGRSYMDGDFFCDDVRSAVLYPLGMLRQKRRLAHPSRFRGHMPQSLPEAWIRTQLVFRDAQSIAASASAIKYHYDREESTFYERVLGRSMMYSCAYFHKTEDLYTAQGYKNRHIAGKQDLRSGDQVLEIGCGWGMSLAQMAELYPGVTFHGITISKAQYDSCLKTHKALIEAGRLKFYLMDYRDVPKVFGKHFFDAVFSIGMLEHVGPDHYDEFFWIIWQCVKFHMPVVIHSIYGNGGIDPFTWYEGFPGGIVPTEAQVMKAAMRYFKFLHGENFGPFYSKTLRAWRGNLLAAEPELLGLGYPERLIRKFDFSYALWDVGFEISQTQLNQFTFASGGIPGTYQWGLRDYSR